MKELNEVMFELGKALKPSEVSNFFNIDVRIVRKYAKSLGGIEIYPGTYRFFSNVIARILYKNTTEARNIRNEKSSHTRIDHKSKSEHNRKFVDKHGILNI